MNKVEIDAKQEESFQKWLASPQTKLAISLIPATSPPEVLLTLLRSTFDAGFGTGIGMVMIGILTEVILKDKK